MLVRLFPKRAEKFKAESRKMPRKDPKNPDDGNGDKADRQSDIDQQISDNLRKLYQSSVDEELPPALQDLLDRLQAQDQSND